MELTSKIEESLKSLEDYADLCLLREEKISAIGEPTRSLDDILEDGE